MPVSWRPLAAAAALVAAAAGAGRATMSIVAVDPATREVGGAGASCLESADGGVLVISDLQPGKWVLHTQSYWTAANQANARARMEAGDSPEAAMDWLAGTDAQGTAGLRQYGAADLDGDSSRSAAFTGAQCGDWKGHRLGRGYAIQGNILLGPRVLDSMEARFLRTPGPLAERLMSALQGANRAGADSRCLGEGVSSRSAFLRVAKPADAAGRFHLDLRVPSRPWGREPIDSLQKLYDRWKAATAARPEAPPAAFRLRVRPGFLVAAAGHPGERLGATLRLLSLQGRETAEIEGRRGPDGVTWPIPPRLRGRALLAVVEAGGRRRVGKVAGF